MNDGGWVPPDLEDISDVWCAALATPIGEVRLAATRVGLAWIDFASMSAQAFLRRLANEFGPVVTESPRHLEPFADQLTEYFDGARAAFALPLDLSMTNGFRREVIEAVARIPYGETSTYSEVATWVGNPRAVRAVTTACISNPLPIVMPCHRVVRLDNAIGGYVGDLSTKAWLLELERGHRPG